MKDTHTAISSNSDAPLPGDEHESITEKPVETVPTVGVVVFKGDEVLLVRKKNHPKQTLQLPGGQVEPGETVAVAAARELLETTGLQADPSRLAVLPNEWHAIIQKAYGTKNFSFRCVLCADYVGNPIETDSAVAEWVQRTTLVDVELAPNTLAAIEAAEQLAV